MLDVVADSVFSKKYDMLKNNRSKIKPRNMISPFTFQKGLDQTTSACLK